MNNEPQQVALPAHPIGYFTTYELRDYVAELAAAIQELPESEIARMHLRERIDEARAEQDARRRAATRV